MVRYGAETGVIRSQDVLCLSQFRELKELLSLVQITYQNDSWNWNLGNNLIFTIGETRKYIDDVTLPHSNIYIHWNSLSPDKIIFSVGGFGWIYFQIAQTWLIEVLI